MIIGREDFGRAKCYIDRELEKVSGHNASSRLLSLPQEVKDQIYGLVCGHQIIQVFEIVSPYSRRQTEQMFESVRSNPGRCHRLCNLEISEAPSEIQIDFPSEGWFTDANTRYDANIYSAMPRAYSSSNDKVDVTLLRTCRQIHKEAGDVLYQTNIFSFFRYKQLRNFIKFTPRAALIRSIRLSSLETFYDHIERPFTNRDVRRQWTHTLKAIKGSMRDLISLYIDVQWTGCVWEAFLETVKDVSDEDIVKAWLRSAGLPWGCGTVGLRGRDATVLALHIYSQ